MKHQNIFPNYNQQNGTFLDLFISTDALHVSGGSYARHQENITVHTASGIVNQYCCLLVSWIRRNYDARTYEYQKSKCFRSAELKFHLQHHHSLPVKS